MVGHTYLGRCIEGFNSYEAGFRTLLLHFQEGNENEYTMEGMNLCFGGISERFGDYSIDSVLLVFFLRASFITSILLSSQTLQAMSSICF